LLCAASLKPCCELRLRRRSEGTCLCYPPVERPTCHNTECLLLQDFRCWLTHRHKHIAIRPAACCVGLAPQGAGRLKGGRRAPLVKVARVSVVVLGSVAAAASGSTMVMPPSAPTVSTACKRV
jgi:hypothetical protein